MKLFTVGPVEMYPETLRISGTQLPYFRNDEFSALMKENERYLLQLCGCSAGRALFSREAEAPQWRPLSLVAFAKRIVF